MLPSATSIKVVRQFTLNILYPIYTKFSYSNTVAQKLARNQDFRSLRRGEQARLCILGKL